MLLRVVLRSKERTLTEDELSGWSAQIVEAVKAIDGVLRG